MSDSLVHPSDLELSMFADDELEAETTSGIRVHLANCAVCRAKVDVSNQERSAITASMTLQAASDTDLAIPQFKRPASLKGFAMANIVTGLVIWLAQFLWKTIFGEVFINVATWATSIYVPDTYELITSTALTYLEEGTAMFDTYLGLIMLTLTTVTVLWLVMAYRKHRAVSSLCILFLVGATTVLPTPASALELRRSEGVVNVAADETINDTLLAAGDTIVIKGDVTGDVVAAGRRIEIEGNVAGNLVAFGESVKVRGQIGGLVLSGGSTVDLEGAQVSGDLWGMGDKINVDAKSTIGRNTTVFGQRAVVLGSTGKDLWSFTELLELDSTVGQNLEVYGNRVRLMDSTHVLGKADLHINSEDLLDRADGARIDGGVEFSILPQDLQPTNRYLTISFYLWQLAKLLSALLVGLALLWLVPAMRGVAVNGGLDGLKTAGIGFITLVSLPIIAAVIAVTLVGIPFAMLGMFAWISCWYLAKIVVAIFIGNMALTNGEDGTSDVKLLLVGLAIVIVAINLPFVGGVINFLLTIVGAGMIAQFTANALSTRNA